jgi:hypothetical protein
VVATALFRGGVSTSQNAISGRDRALELIFFDRLVPNQEQVKI